MNSGVGAKGRVNGKGRTRCAIYTRKSSEEGLEQAFNSLDAQREACEAYVQSQQHEGWQARPQSYDDGGISGSTLERPALQRLLADIKAGHVDVVVVYKVDRLTRTLSDFARLVEIFDTHQVSFVSVTQQFNTTTSMGRLTLNVLLSFAQFEREVTGERIRDKIAASKRKGMWMGGFVPLGYNVKDRCLIPNPSEVSTVRRLYQLYLEHKNVREVRAAAGRGNLRSKTGKLFSRGQLYHLLQNPLYIGEVRYKEERHPGLHEAIIDHDTWKAVQVQLAKNRVARRHGRYAKEPSLLTGLLFDEEGRGFTPSHALKKGRRYRYYIQRTREKRDGVRHRPQRIAAGEIEKVLLDALIGLLRSPMEVIEATGLENPSADQAQIIQLESAGLAGHLTEPRTRNALIRELVSRVVLAPTSVVIHLNRTPLRNALGLTLLATMDDYTLTVPARLKRKGVELKLVIESPGTESVPAPDPTLIKAIVRGHEWWKRWSSGEAGTLNDLAKADGMTIRYLRRVMRLAFLAPDIKQAILDGRQPVELTAERLTRLADLPLDWVEQRHLLGFS